MNKSILDVFYNVLIKEAMVGRVDCYFKYNIRFDTKIISSNLDYIGNDNNSLLVPTLLIKNKEEFDKLLVEYVEKAMEFYGDDNFCDEVIDSNYYDDELGISKEKVIMTMLWSNATIEDFNDPCKFLKKRISFFELGELEKFLQEELVGYSKLLGYDINVMIEKNGLENETPYSLKVNLVTVDNGARIYEFPKVYFGIYDGDGYIYAIQNDRYRLINSNYTKKIDRLLYKVNEGLDVKSDTSENYGIGNLKDVTPNFVVVANIMMGLFKNNNINKIKVPSILISRWNAKMILLQNRIDKKISSEIIDDLENKFIYIQSNLTEKFLRVFRRLCYHHSTMMISSSPYELSSNLEISILDGINVCNNQLLDEFYNFYYSRNLNNRKL